MKLSEHEKEELRGLIENNSSNPARINKKTYNRYRTKTKLEDSLLEGDGKDMEKIILEKVKSDGKTRRLKLWLKFSMFIILALIFIVRTGKAPIEWTIDFLKEIILNF